MTETFEFVVPMVHDMASAIAYKTATDTQIRYVVHLSDPRILSLTQSSVIQFQFLKEDPCFTNPSTSYAKILTTFKSPNRLAEKWIIEGLRIREAECLRFTHD
ncbi:MAG: hypothetical protein INR73_18805 [Williamsia sp.]|nr:hypothetical protein [Williamsia sp.]